MEIQWEKPHSRFRSTFERCSILKSTLRGRQYFFQFFLVFMKEEHISFQAEKARERSNLKKRSPHKTIVFFVQVHD